MKFSFVWRLYSVIVNKLHEFGREEAYPIALGEESLADAFDVSAADSLLGVFFSCACWILFI